MKRTQGAGPHISIARTKSPARRGVALIMVLLVVALAATMALGFLGSQGTLVRVSENASTHIKARHLAESGIEFARTYIQSSGHWRDDRLPGIWINHFAWQGGTLTVAAEDGADRNGDGTISAPSEGDGDFTDDAQDPVTFTSTGTISGISRTVRVVITIHEQSSAMAHYKFDSDSGQLAFDSTGNTSAAVLENDSLGAGWCTGKVDGAFEFDGFDDLFVTPSSSNQLQVGNDYSATVWIFAEGSQKSWAGIFSRCSPTGNDNHYTLQFDNRSGDTKRITMYHPNGHSWRTSYLLSDCKNAWHHLAVTYQKSPPEAQLFVDGVLYESTTSLTQGPGLGAGELHIGGERTSSPNYVFKGMIDDLRIYDDVLTAEQVRDIYLGTDDSLTGELAYGVDWRN